jgi:hypothetical protein
MGNKGKLAASKQDGRRPRTRLARPGEAPEGECAGTASNARGVRHLKGVQDINTGVSRAMHSVPPRSDRYYLDLYLLQMESERLNQEAASLGKRNTRIERRLAEISSEMAEKQQKAIQGKGSETPLGNRKSRQKGYAYNEDEWNRMSVNY